MKASTPLLLLSFAANLALGAAALWRTSAPATVGSPAANLAPAVPLPPAAPVGPVAPDPKAAQQLHAASDAEFVARLRAEGFPPNMLFALVSLRLRERHAEALRKFQPAADYAYWRKTTYGGEELPPEDRAARRALERQIADERRQLLGSESDLATSYERANRERLYGNLPVEKIDQLSALNRDYGEISALLRDRTQGVVLPEDRERFAALEREKRADLVALLSPEELLEYDMRSSPSAATVRSQLRAFDATEEEYRAIATLQLAFDATYGSPYNLGGEQQQRRTEASAELTAQIKALLPPERFAEYEIKTDPAYMRVASMLSYHNLPAEVTNNVISAQRDLAQRFNALRNNRDLAPEVRNARLDTLSAEANQRMADLLGPEAFPTFKNNGGPINALLNRSGPPRP